jgi:carbamoyl-phosphate synthase small subunit
MKMMLVLEDGSSFSGESFGAEAEVCGWVHNDYGVVGYQETLTDPDNRGMLVNMTYPLIGNYGVNAEDGESDRAQASALLVRERSRIVSNWRAEGSLSDWMKERGVVGMDGVDTRTLALRLRDRGEMRGVIAPAALPVAELLSKVRAYTLKETSKVPSAPELIRGAVSSGTASGAFTEDGRYRVVVWDLGVRRSCIAQLEAGGCQVVRAPFTVSWEEIGALRPEGVLISNGPGDPRDLAETAAQIRKALGKLPMIGVALGCQLLALAGGGRIGALKTGHHGVNYPVREAATGRDAITSQNHRLVIDAGSIAGTDFRVSHVNLNDGSVEGIAAEGLEAAGVQFIPLFTDDGAPGAPFAEFIRRMERRRKAGAQPFTE